MVRGAVIRSGGIRRRWRPYLRESRRPLHSLVLLLPLALAFEVGAGVITRGGGAGETLLARSMIRGVLGWFGLVGAWVPAVALVAGLLWWHQRRQDRLRVRVWVLGGMLLESAVLAIPLLVISGLFVSAASGAAGVWVRFVVALGAGIYEELVFRLALIPLVTLVAVRMFRMSEKPAQTVAVFVTALLFALCHFAPVGVEVFDWRTLWFKLLAGVYLGQLFVMRGMGIAAGTHVAYNVVLVGLRCSL